MTIHDNNSPHHQHHRPAPSGYGGRPNPLASLLNKGISPHQVSGRAQPGFRDYSYARGNATSGLESMFSDAVVVSDEQLKAQITDLAVYKGNELCSFLQRKIGRYYELAKKAISIFSLLDQTGTRDPVLVSFADELLSNVKLYNYCCTYACLIVSAKFVDIELSGEGDNFRSAPGAVDSLIVDSLLDAFAMEFLQWFEHHPEAINLQRRMHNITRARIEKIEGALDRIQYMVTNLDNTGKMPIPFPYKAGVLKRVMQRSYADTPVYDSSNYYGSEMSLTDSWGSSTSSAHINTASKPQRDWLDDYFAKTDNGSHQSNYHDPDPVGPYDNHSTAIDDIWADLVEPTEKVSVQLVDEAKKVTRKNRLGYDPHQWFIRIPDDHRYVIHPESFKYISQQLEYDGTDAPYSRSGWEEQGCVPVVTLDWERGLYTYQNVYVGEDKMSFILTNPERVLPKLSVVDEELQISNFDKDVVEELDKAVEESIKRQSSTECRILDKPPKAVYGNAPIVIANGDDVIRSVREVERIVKAKVDYKPEVLVLPMTARRLLPIEDKSFDYRIIEEKLPFLINGSKKEYDLESFLSMTKTGFISVGSRQLGEVIVGHITSVINRWFVERRFYNEAKDGVGGLKIDCAFKDIPELLKLMRKHDPNSMNELLSFLSEPFFAENIPLFATTETQEKLINSRLERIDDPLLMEARKEELTQSVCIEKSFALAKINPMEPLKTGSRAILQGSSMPEIRWLMDTAPKRVHKHFNRDVPLVLCFSKDDTFKPWVATRSAFCNSKFSLRELETDNLSRFRILK